MKHLKSLLPLLLILLFPLSQETCQAQVFSKGSADLNLQIGFGTTYYLNSTYSAGLPLLSAAVDYGLRDDWGPGVFGIGGIIGVHTLKHEPVDPDFGYKYTRVVLAPRATYHYQLLDKFDTYGGALLGLDIVSDNKYGDWTGEDAKSKAGVGAVFSIYIGAKMYVTDKFSIMTEFYAFDMAFFNLIIRSFFCF